MFDPRAFLTVAERALTGIEDEAMQRSGISRSYYAAFLVAREYIYAHGMLVHPPSGKRWGSHERVIFSVGALRQPDVRSVRQALFRLKKQRTGADYELEYFVNRERVAKALQDAQMIISWFDGLP